MVLSYIVRITPWFTLIFLWWLITLPGGIDPLFLASPEDTFRSFFEGIKNYELVEATVATLRRVFVGIFLATFFGVALGLLLGGVPIVKTSLGPLVDALRSMPATALFPVFLLTFGVGDTAKIAVVVYVCTWAVAVVTADTLETSAPMKLFLLKLHKVTLFQRFFDGMLMPILPTILATIRAIAGLAFVIMIAMEMIVGTNVGLGRVVYESQVTYRMPTMYAAILMSGLVGVLLNIFLSFLNKHLLHWR